MSQLLETKDAALHCGLPLKFFRNQIRAGAGPLTIRPSPHRVFFRVEDLNKWMASWRRDTPSSSGSGEAHPRTGGD